VRGDIENSQSTRMHVCIFAITVWYYGNFVLQLRNILQQVDYYLNKSGKREG